MTSRTELTHAPAVVVGLDCTTGLQSARILAHRGIPVVGIAADARHPCARTRVCRQVVQADTAGEALVEALAALGPRLEERAVLLPCTDLAVLRLSRHRAELAPWFHLVLPEADTVEMLVDKARFHAWAVGEGLPVPRGAVLACRDDVEAACGELRFPCILKPSVKTPEWKRRTRAKAFRVEDAAALRAEFERCAPWAERLVVQEWVPGGDRSHYTCNCYFTRRGLAEVAFTSRKLRQWPPVGGEGCLSEEARSDAVRHATLQLFARAGHRGLGYAEVKRDERTGEHLVLEPNVGRPTGRAAQAEAAGVELLLTVYRDALGLPLPEAREQRYAGVKWVHARRDLQAAVYQWRRGELTLREWARSWRGPRVDALFSWSDPVPFWADLGHTALEFARGRKRPPRAATAPAAEAAA
jgi:D-aspartate ligase